MPSFKQWLSLPANLERDNKNLFTIAISLIIACLIFLFINYIVNTELTPTSGGHYIEGVVGQPRFINPIYAINDVDRDLTQLTFSGLMKYQNDGSLTNDLIEQYSTNDWRTFNTTLKNDLFWSDGHPLTADDVIFTIRAIQDSSYKSPHRASWVGIEVTKISDTEIVFKLEKPSVIFLENLTVKIIPRHIWGEIMPQNLVFSQHNLNPITSGPYKIRSINQDRQEYINSINLEPNPYYHGQKPYIHDFSFRFFNKEADVSGVSGSPVNLNMKANVLNLPRYFAVFLNPEKNVLFQDNNVRNALNISLDKEQLNGQPISSPLLDYENEYDLEKAKTILAEAGFENGVKVIKEESTFNFSKDLKVGDTGEEVRQLQRCLIQQKFLSGQITGFFNTETKNAVIDFQEAYREEVLAPGGLSRGTGTVSVNTRRKLNEVCSYQPENTANLSFTLHTVDQPRLQKVANWIKDEWSKIGIQVNIETVDIQTLERDIIRTREYEALLFGNALRSFPDLLPFFHSSQTQELNLSLYQNKEVDRWLEEARSTLDNQEIIEKIANKIKEDQPAIFLYTPDYIYYTTHQLKGFSAVTIIDPSRRFVDIENWHLKTTRK
jgi:peptide/nickel transport system substrate-binding protein